MAKPATKANDHQKVFGANVKFDAQGKPIETGSGHLRRQAETSHAVNQQVFGFDVAYDAQGRPVEQGSPHLRASGPSGTDEAHRLVFGADVKFDAAGKPIETGIGSKAIPDRNPTL